MVCLTLEYIHRTKLEYRTQAVKQSLKGGQQSSNMLMNNLSVNEVKGKQTGTKVGNTAGKENSLQVKEFHTQ